MKTIKKITILSLLAGALLAGCGLLGDETPQINGTSWRLVEIEGQEIVPNSEVNIRFEEGRVEGSGGCNAFGGEYTLNPDGTIDFGPLASTRMACEGGLMDQEFAFFQALDSVVAVRVAGESLLMEGTNGSVLLSFEPLAGE